MIIATISFFMCPEGITWEFSLNQLLSSILSNYFFTIYLKMPYPISLYPIQNFMRPAHTISILDTYISAIMVIFNSPSNLLITNIVMISNLKFSIYFEYKTMFSNLLNHVPMLFVMLRSFCVFRMIIWQIISFIFLYSYIVPHLCTYRLFDKFFNVYYLSIVNCYALCIWEENGD